MANKKKLELCAFDNKYDLLAIVSADNRLKIFDTASGNLLHNFVDDRHLSESYTCIAWGNETPTTTPKKKAKKSAMLNHDPNDKREQVGVIALGTWKGYIILWDLKNGTVSHRLGGKSGEGGHTARVTDLVFNSACNSLFSSSADRQVIQWNVKTGEVINKFQADKLSVGKLALSPDGTKLATASTSIKLWDLSSTKVLQKFIGHAKPTCGLCFSKCGRFILSTSGDRFISLWDCEGEINNGEEQDDDDQNRQAIKVFSCGSNPIAIAVNNYDNKNSQFCTFLAMTDSKEISIWQYNTHSLNEDEDENENEDEDNDEEDGDNKKKGKKRKKNKSTKLQKKKVAATKPIMADSIIKLTGKLADPKKRHVIIHAGFSSAKNEIVVAHSNGILPTCVRTKYRDEENGEMLRKIIIRTDDGDNNDASNLASRLANNKKESKIKLESGKAKVLGAADMAIPTASSNLDEPTQQNKGGQTLLTTIEERRLQQKSENQKLTNNSNSNSNSKKNKEMSLQEKLDLLLIKDEDDDEEDDEDDEEEDDDDDNGISTLGEKGKNEQKKKEGEKEGTTITNPETARTLMQLNAGETPKAESLQAVLAQALHTKDRALLESVLGVSDDEVIDNTTARLPTKYVVPFLATVITLFRTKPNRGVTLTRWIRSVMVHHAAYLITVPDLLQSLASLYQTIDARVTVFKRFMKLSGRLDLLLSQIEQQQQRTASVLHSKPLVMYQEGDSDSEDEDDEDENDEDEDDDGDEDDSEDGEMDIEEEEDDNDEDDDDDDDEDDDSNE